MFPRNIFLVLHHSVNTAYSLVIGINMQAYTQVELNRKINMQMRLSRDHVGSIVMPQNVMDMRY